jgi:hypothetical protein
MSNRKRRSSASNSTSKSLADDGADNPAEHKHNNDDDDEFVLDDDDDADYHTSTSKSKKKAKKAAAAPSTTDSTTTPSVTAAATKPNVSGDVSAADIKAIKERNAGRSDSVAYGRVDRLSGDLVHVNRRNVGPTAASLGIPYSKAQVGYSSYGPRYCGIVVQRRDYDDLMLGVKFAKQKKTRARANKAERSAARRERETNAARAEVAEAQPAGFMASPEFYALVSAADDFDAAVVNAVKATHATEAIDVGSPDAAVAAAARTKLTDALSDMKERKQELDAALRAFGLPPLPLVLPSDAMAAVVDILTGDARIGDRIPVVVAALEKSGAYELSWKALLVARCTPCAQLGVVAPEISGDINAVADLRAAVLADIGEHDDGGDANDDDNDSDLSLCFAFDRESDHVWLRGADVAQVNVARRLFRFDAKLRELQIDFPSASLQREREKLADNVDEVGDKQRAQLEALTIPNLRAEARRLGAPLHGATRKDDIVAAIVSFSSTVEVREARLDGELRAFLVGESLAAEAASLASTRAFLAEQCAPELLTVAVKRFADFRSWDRRGLLDAAREALVHQRLELLRKCALRAAPTATMWNGTTVTLPLPKFDELFASDEFLTASRGKSSATVVSELVAATEREQQAWIAEKAHLRQHQLERKALLDAQLLGVGYGVASAGFVFVGGREVDTSPELVGPVPLQITLGPSPWSDTISAFLASEAESFTFPATLSSLDRLIIHELLRNTPIKHESSGWSSA